MPDTWEALEHDCKNCRECSLWETRTNVVFGVGNQNAEVLFIGEGPGANEDAHCCAIRAAGPSRLRISRAYSRRSMSFASTPMPFPNANSILFGAVPCQIPT